MVGDPQSSILVDTLFITFINDLLYLKLKLDIQIVLKLLVKSLTKKYE